MKLRQMILAGTLVPAMLIAAACETEPVHEEAVVTETSTTVATPGTGGDALNAPPTTTDTDALEATAGDVLRTPAAYEGRVVTVTGDVDRTISPRSFVIDSTLATGDLLVLSPEPVPNVTDARGTRELMQSDAVVVTGRIINFTIPEIESEVGWDVGREIEVEFENQPVLIVERMSATPENQTGATN